MLYTMPNLGISKAGRRRKLVLLSFLLISISIFSYKSGKDEEKKELEIDNRLQQDDLIFHYTPHFDTSLKGLGLKLTKELYQRFFVPEMRFISIQPSFIHELVFVIFFSENHYEEGKDAIGSIQKFYPRKKILAYDLGLNKSQIKELESFCSVEYIPFQWDIYPVHVQKLLYYAWKPLVVLDALQNYTTIFWLDASIRFLTGNMSILFAQLHRAQGILQFKATASGFKVPQVTWPTLYEYFPTELKKLTDTYEYGTGATLILRTQQIYEDVLKWWFLCALIKDCIAPSDKVICSWKQLTDGKFGNCHRYEQSAINVLISNANFFKRPGLYNTTRFISVNRKSRNLYPVKIC